MRNINGILSIAYYSKETQYIDRQDKLPPASMAGCCVGYLVHLMGCATPEMLPIAHALMPVR